MIYNYQRGLRMGNWEKIKTIIFIVVFAITLYGLYLTIHHLGDVLWTLSTPLVNLMK